MDSCLKLVSCALSAILKRAHLHNKQFCEKGLGAIRQLSERPCFGIQLNLAQTQDWEKNVFHIFQKKIVTREQFSCLRNPVFEICSNGFSHFKLSQAGCKSSSLVNGHKKCRNRVFKFRLKAFSTISDI